MSERLTALTYDDADEIVRLEWRLRQMLRRDADDNDARVTLVRALSVLGRRQEAVEEAGRAYDLSCRSPTFRSRELPKLLAGLGLIDEAVDISRRLLAAHPTPAVDPFLSDQVATSALVAGDAALLSMARERAPQDGAFVLLAWPILENSGMLPHLASHQRVVLSVIRQHMCGLNMLVTLDDVPTVMFDYLLDVDRPERRRISRLLSDALYDHYLRSAPMGRPDLALVSAVGMIAYPSRDAA